jgi:5-methylcytosine-specific restriction protein B
METEISIENKDVKNFWLFIIPLRYGDNSTTLWEYCRKNNVAAMQYQEGKQSKYKRNINLIKKINKGNGIVAYLGENRIGGLGIVTKEFYENLDENNGFGGRYGQRIDVEWKYTSDEGFEIQEIKDKLSLPKNLGLQTIHNISKDDFNRFKDFLNKNPINDGIKIIEDEMNDQLNKLLRNKKQIIFYGPPGTGKTYNARKIAVEFIGGVT